MELTTEQRTQINNLVLEVLEKISDISTTIDNNDKLIDKFIETFARRTRKEL